MAGFAALVPASVLETAESLRRMNKRQVRPVSRAVLTRSLPSKF